MADKAWTIRLTGNVRVDSDTWPRIDRFRSKSAAAVLAYIAIHESRPVTRDELAEAVWPEGGQEESRQNLRTALSSLRKQLEPNGLEGLVLGSDRSLVWLSKETVTSDIAEFARLVGLAENESSPTEKVKRFTSALEWIRGEALGQIHFDWALPHQLALEEAYAKALCEAVDAMIAIGMSREALGVSRRGLTLFPTREDVHVAAIRSCAASGLTSEAIKQFETLEKVLDDAWGEKPGQAAIDALRALPEAPESHGLTAALARRAAAESTRRAEPDRAAVSIEPQRHPTLPPLLKRLFGRSEETERLKVALDPADEESPRLWTVIGVGGSGKSSLALRVGHALAHGYQGRIHFVALSEVRDPEWFLASVCEALDLPRTTPEENWGALIGLLSGDPALLILDGFEGLVDGASETVRNLLVACPKLRVLLTSRRTASLEVERVLALQPLSVPEPGSRLSDVQDSPSVKLFLDRAQALRRDFQLSPTNSEAVVQICRRLDGLPLALELAAAHMAMTSPAQLLVRLGDTRILTSNRKDVPDRHRSLSAVMESSYESLGEQERRLFRMIGCFRGGAGLDGIEAVSDAVDTLQVLEELCSSSLLLTEETATGVRFRMLEPVREFAWQRCTAEGEDQEVLKRHRDWCCELAKRIREMYEGRHGKEALDLGDAEHDNLRWAADSALKLEECPGVTLTMLGKLLPFITARGHSVEWRVRGQALLAMRLPEGWVRETASAFNTVGQLSALTGHVGEAVSLLETSRERLEGAGQPLSMSACLNNLGNARLLSRDAAGARSCWESALASTDQALTEEPDRQVAIRMAALGNLAGLLRYLDEPEGSRALLTEALESSRERGQSALSCQLLADLSQVYLDLDRCDLAENALAEAEEQGRQVGATSLEGNLSLCRAWACVRRGELDKAVALSWHGVRIGREIESPSLTAVGLTVFSAAALREGREPLAIELIAAATSLEPGFDMALAPWQREASGIGLSAHEPSGRWSEHTFDLLLERVAAELASSTV